MVGRPNDEADVAQEVPDEPPEHASPGDEDLCEGGNSLGKLEEPKRHRFTSEQTMLLEHVFRGTPLPPKTVILQLAERLSVRVCNVRIWFQNRRQRFRASHSG